MPSSPQSALSPDALPPLARRPVARGLMDGLFAGYFILMALALIALRFPGAMPAGNELNVDRSIFTVINAATLSGFQLHVGTGLFQSGHPLGAVVVFTLTLAGAFFTLVVASMAVTRLLRLRYSDSDIIAAAFATMLIAILAGAAALLGEHRTLADALLQAASAFGNSGVYTGALPGLGDWQTYLVLMPLAVLGGLGLPVLMELYQAAMRGMEALFRSLLPYRTGVAPAEAAVDSPPVLSDYARTILRLTALLYLAGFILLLIGRDEFWTTLWAGITQGGWTHQQGLSLRYALLSSSVAGINSRSAGFPFEYTDLLPRVSQWVLMGLMMIGASPAGTGGGLKTTTGLQLIRGVRDALSGRGVSRAFGIAGVWLGGYLLIVLIGFVVLLWQVPQLASDKLLLLSISAVSNVGLSNDTLSLVSGPLYTLSLLMLIGRLAPLGVLWWMVRTVNEPEMPIG